jgi:hypothetical protein
VDTLGLLLAVVTAAGVQDRDGAHWLLGNPYRVVARNCGKSG